MSTELTEAEREDVGSAFIYESEPEVLFGIVARIKAAARREALLEAARHFTRRANEASHSDLHMVSDAWDMAASDLRALAEPERDEEGGR